MNNFTSTNLLPKEIERIKNSQFNNSKSFLKVVIIFISTLVIMYTLIEYISLCMPTYYLNIRCIKKQDEAKEDQKREYCDENSLFRNNYIFISIFLILQLISFPFITFSRMLTRINIKRRLLLILYCLLLIAMAVNIYSINLSNYFICIVVTSVIYALSHLIIGTTYLLSEKIIPSFVKICGLNVKFILSYLRNFGSIIGGVLFCVLIWHNLEQDSYNNFQSDMEISAYIFGGLTIVGFSVLLFFYFSLRVRALSKLRFIEE